MSGEKEVHESEEPTATGREADPLTVIADPVVIDLREGIDTIAAYEAAAAERAAKAPTRKVV